LKASAFRYLGRAGTGAESGGGYAVETLGPSCFNACLHGYRDSDTVPK